MTNAVKQPARRDEVLGVRLTSGERELVRGAATLHRERESELARRAILDEARAALLRPVEGEAGT